MFTGLVEETGEVRNIEESGEGKRIEIEADKVLEDLKVGDSISVSGACLTAEELDSESFEVFLSEETLEKTWFSQLEENDQINLERALRPEDRMGGHFVQGHVEAASQIVQIEELEKGWNFTFKLPSSIEKYVVEKGFITIEGISLTITERDSKTFSVTIIPETWKKTNLSRKSVGNPVNLESDVLAKYAENFS